MLGIYVINHVLERNEIIFFFANTDSLEFCSQIVEKREKEREGTVPVVVKMDYSSDDWTPKGVYSFKLKENIGRTSFKWKITWRGAVTLF
ncbi:MAG: hypothetical protein ACTS6G_06110 [Candidatus Hodgkinia cicadicola]